jgi:glutathione S-transferase
MEKAAENANAATLKLFGSWASSFTHRVQLALRLKGLEFEYVEEDLSSKSEDLLRLNPVYKKVPVLVHGGRALPESVVILQYLDDAWPETRPLLPANSVDRALARFWCHFVDDKVPCCAHPLAAVAYVLCFVSVCDGF